MDDKKDSSNYNGGKAKLKRERSFMSEHRLETLQSLSRLVENDFKSEMLDTEKRRVSLPSFPDDNVTIIEPAPGYWRRNSSVVDYMQELTSKRRELIQRLVPHIENVDTNKDVDSDRISEQSGREVNLPNLRGDGQLSPLHNSTISEQELQVNTCTLSDEMDTNASDKDDTLGVIRERIAKFESIKSIPRRSINADDFQQFLGERYLEIYQKRAIRNSVSKITDKLYDQEQDSLKNLSRHKNGIKETSQGHHNRSLNTSIRSMHGLSNSNVTSDYKGLGQNLKISLPPIMKGRESDRKCLLDSRRSILELNSRYVNGFVPIHNDLADDNLERPRTKGIPHHTAKRANKRYHESREIHSILNELRKLSSTVQKSEQEDFIHKLEDDY